MEPQWSNFKLRVNVKTSPVKAYQAWTTPAGLESWFLRKAIFTDGQGKQLEKDDAVKPGDTYDWYWHGYPDSVVEKGKVLNANGKDMMCFTFSMGCPWPYSFMKNRMKRSLNLSKVICLRTPSRC